MDLNQTFQIEELKNYYKVLGALLGIYTFLLVFGEYLYKKYMLKQAHSNELLVSNSSGLVGILTQGVFSKLVTASLMWFFYSHRFFNPTIDVYLWIECFVVSSFIQWFNHYLYHKVRLLWCFHIVHHTAQEMSFATAIRTSVLDIFTIESVYFIIPLLGIPPVMYFILYVFYKIWGMFIHVNDDFMGYKDIPVLKNIVVTPLFHKIHHAKNEQYLDKNFSEITPLYDKLFGTYATFTEVPSYGITKNQPAQTFWEVQTHEFKALWHDIKSTDSFSNKLKYIFYPPGWEAIK